MNFNENEIEKTVGDIVDNVVDIFGNIDEPILEELRSIASDFISDFDFNSDY
jgi:hypothetical protein